MKAIIDTGTLGRQWIAAYKKNKALKPSMDRIALISNFLCRNELQAGRPCNHDPDWKIYLELSMHLPGMSDYDWSTWCTFGMAGIFGIVDGGISIMTIKTTRDLYNEVIRKSKRFGKVFPLGAGYYSADVMHDTLVKQSTIAGSGVHEHQWDQAQKLANSLEIVIIASHGIGKSVGHVGTVAPLPWEISGPGDMYAAQAGAKNGFYVIAQIFNEMNGVTMPRYFTIDNM